jgi:pimeloyl-ACP methyl ester carboxylesterase
VEKPIGKILEVDAHKMHIYAIGQGGPSIIFESGGAGWCMDWTIIQQEVSKFATAISYDRSGFGWSEPGTLPRDANQIEKELHSLLEKAEVRKPYILVGASFGGHIVRLYASRHPNDVAGIVLLDARHEYIDLKMPNSWKKVVSIGRFVNQFMLVLSQLRLLKLFGTLLGKNRLPPIVKHLPIELRSKYLNVGFQTNYFRTNRNELDAINSSDHQLRSVRSLGDIPLVVIKHGILNLFSSMPATEAKIAEEIWHDLQLELAGTSTNSEFIIAEKSGHAIHVDQPELVITTICKMIKEYEKRKNLI